MVLKETMQILWIEQASTMRALGSISLMEAFLKYGFTDKKTL